MRSFLDWRPQVAKLSARCLFFSMEVRMISYWVLTHSQMVWSMMVEGDDEMVVGGGALSEVVGSLPPETCRTL